MDPINIFRNQIPIVSTTPEEPEDLVQPQPAGTPPTNLGIASATDVIEDASASPSYLPFQKNDYEAPATSLNQFAKAETETVDAASMFEYFDFPSAAKIPKVDGESLKSGQVSWETIEFLKTELTNKNPDVPAMMNKLLELDPDDLAVTLMKMKESGNTSELGKLVSSFCGNPETIKKMGSLLARVAENLPAEKLQPVLSEMIHGVSGDRNVMFMDFVELTKEKDILPYLNQECVTNLFNGLMWPTSIEGSLSALALGKENSLRPPVREGTVWGVADPSTLMTSFLNGERKDQSVADAFAAYPEWAVKEINKMLVNPGTVDVMLHTMMQSGQDFGPFLTEFCKQPGSEAALGHIFSFLNTDRLTSNPTSQYPIAISTIADDHVRRMVEGLGSEALSYMSKLPPMTLLDIKAILQRGNDSAQNQSIIQNLIDPAYQAAKQA